MMVTLEMSGKKTKTKSKKAKESSSSASSSSSSSSSAPPDQYSADCQAFMYSFSHQDREEDEAPKKEEAPPPKKEEREPPRQEKRKRPKKPSPQPATSGSIPLPKSTAHTSGRAKVMSAPDPSSAAR
jgi:hypothetical protein